MFNSYLVWILLLVSSQRYHSKNTFTMPGDGRRRGCKR